MTEQPKAPEHDELCDALLGYLDDHPNAMDTIEGIASWWIPRRDVPVEQVAAALRTLEARQLIERIGSEERPMFRVRRPR